VNRNKDSILTTIIVVSVVLMFAADGGNAILRALGVSLREVSISLYVRLFVTLLFLLLTVSTVRGRRVIIFIAALTGCYLLGAGRLAMRGTDLGDLNIVGNIVQIQKMTFAFLCWAVIFTYFQRIEVQDRLFKVYEWLVIIQVLSVLLGFIFQIDLFKAYAPERGRFGYKGLIPAINETTGFFLLAACYYGNKLFLARVLDGRAVIWFLVLLAGALSGSKACLGVVILIAVGYVGIHAAKAFYLPRRALPLTLLLPGVVAGALALGYMDKAYRPIAGYLGHMIGQYRLAEERYPGSAILFVSTSARTLKAATFWEEAQPNWSAWNYLFGGWNLYEYYIEVDPIDLFALFGVVGTTIFYMGYIKMWGIGMRGPFFLLFPFALWMAVSCTAGHLVSSAINGTYLSIFLLSVQRLKQRNMNGLGDTAGSGGTGEPGPALDERGK